MPQGRGEPPLISAALPLYRTPWGFPSACGLVGLAEQLPAHLHVHPRVPIQPGSPYRTQVVSGRPVYDTERLGGEVPSCRTYWTGTRWLVLNRHTKPARCGVVMPIGADRAPRAGPACPSSGAAEAEARLSLRALGFPKRACRCCATRPCCPRLPRRTGKVESYGRSGPGDRAQLSTPSPLRTVAGPASPDPSHA